MTTFHPARAATAAFLAALAVAISGPAPAAPQTVAEIATYQGADRQAVFEAGARKEGSMLVYVIGTQSDPMFKRFQELYPYVRLEVYRAPTNDLTRRVLEEYKAGRHIVDSIDATTGGLQEILGAGHLQPFYSPEMSAYPAQAIEAGKRWVIDYEGYVGMGWNTAEVKAADVPKTWDDLLDPKWKGKMALSGIGSTMGNWMGALLRDKDEAFVRKLGEQQPKVYNIISRGVANLVVSGEVPLSPQIFDAHMRNSKDKGAKVSWAALGGVYANVNAVSLANKAPHPHAAMLYIDFTLGKEGQSMRLDIGNSSARTDLVFEGKPTKVYYLSEEPNYIENFDKWTAFSRRVFGAGQAHPTEK